MTIVNGDVFQHRIRASSIRFISRFLHGAATIVLPAGVEDWPIFFLQGCGICHIRVSTSAPVPFGCTVWLTSCHAGFHNIFNKVTTMAKEVFWIEFFSVRPKRQTRKLAASRAFVQITSTMSSHSSFSTCSARCANHASYYCL